MQASTAMSALQALSATEQQPCCMARWHGSTHSGPVHVASWGHKRTLYTHIDTVRLGTPCRMCHSLQRLHPNHVQPRNIHAQYNSGWTMFFQPARTQGQIPPGALQAQHPDAAFAAFLATASRPLEQLQQQQQLRLAAAAANPWAHVAPATPATGPMTAQLPYAGATGSSGHGAPPQQYQPQQPYMHAGLQMQPASGPPSSSYQQQPQHMPNELGLVAQPGESDEAFAQRLAAMYGSSPGGSPASTAPVSAANSNAPSRLGSSTAPTTRPPQQDNPFMHGPAGSDNPFRTHGVGSGEVSQQAQQQLEPARLSDGGAPSAPPSVPVASALPTAVPSAAAATGGSVQMGMASSSGADPYVGGDADADLCVICLSAPREVGLLHGASVHKCLCKECAPMVRVGAPCPLCRQNVERVLGVY